MAVASEVVLLITAAVVRSALMEVATKAVNAESVTRRSLCPAGGLIVAVIALKKGPVNGAVGATAVALSAA
ncbi:MAG: hypothetical protein DMG13_07830 [Acidobacteria bacterium]|nr:MAG: hypothetical protein DMG13_07830 [Acidobacteriota bacterium]